MTAVLQELLAVVGNEGDQRVVAQTQTLELLDQALDLGVHGADRAVIPRLLGGDEGLGVDRGLLEIAGSGQAVNALALLDDLLQIPLVIGDGIVVEPAPIVRGERPERAVGVEDVQKHEEGLVAVGLDPRQQTVDIGARRLAAMAFETVDRSPLVEHFDALLEIAVLAGERHRGGVEGSVAGLAKDLRESGDRRRHSMGQVVDAVGRGVERGEDRRYRDLGPRALRDVVGEACTLGGEPLQGGRRVPLVSPRGEVIAAQGVGDDQNDSLSGSLARQSLARRGAVARFRQDAAMPQRGRAPVADAARVFGGQLKLQLDPPLHPRQIHRHPFPALGACHRLVVNRAPICGPHCDRKGDRVILRRAHRQIEPGALAHLALPDDALRRAGDHRLAKHTAQAVPADSGRHLSEVLATRDHP